MRARRPQSNRSRPNRRWRHAEAGLRGRHALLAGLLRRGSARNPGRGQEDHADTSNGARLSGECGDWISCPRTSGLPAIAPSGRQWRLRPSHVTAWAPHAGPEFGVSRSIRGLDVGVHLCRSSDPAISLRGEISSEAVPVNAITTALLQRFDRRYSFVIDPLAL